MDTVTGFTADRMLAMENATVVDGDVVGGNLILKTKDNTEINAGSVIGPIGPIGPDGNPVGTILMGGWTVAPTGYHMLSGQTIVGGVAAFSALAAQYPSWVSGADLVLPNAVNVVPLGSTAPAGVIAGSMTHTLATNQIPNHQHEIFAHDHTLPSHTHTTPNHQHTSPDHTHGVNIWRQGMGHELVKRESVGGGGFWTGTNTNGDSWLDPDASNPLIFILAGMRVTYIADHAHYVSGTSDINSLVNSLTNSGGGGTTGSTNLTTNLFPSTGDTTLTKAESATKLPVDHTPRHLTVRYIVKY